MPGMWQHGTVLNISVVLPLKIIYFYYYAIIFANLPDKSDNTCSMGNPCQGPKIAKTILKRVVCYDNHI